MDSLFRDFFPNNALFFDLFDQATKNSAEMAELLLTVVNSETADERELLFKRIDRMEQTGDDITHKIHLHLNKIVFTPLNRSDIHALASAIDDVADSIQEASGRMYLYNVVELWPPIKEIASLTRLASLEMEQAVSLLRSSKKRKSIFELCRRIKTCEQQSDQVYCNSVARLFSDEADAIKVLKYRDILFSLETALNKCKNVTNVLNVILVKR